MRAHTPQTALTALASLLLLPSLTSAIGFDCAHILVDKVPFDLSPLGGVHEISHFEKFDEYSANTTYVLNICNILQGAARRGNLNCGTSKNICGFEEINIFESGEVKERELPIAGFDTLGGGKKDPEITRLKSLDSSTEGVRVKLAGGKITDAGSPTKGKPASAVIEFQCDHDRTGLEGLKNDDELDKATASTTKKLARRDDNDNDNGNEGDKDGDKKDDTPTTKSPSLQFKSFGLIDDESYVLRLDWKTKYACEDVKRDTPSGSSGGGHWGFFTWVIIILFLCIAAYLIFGSWLNYNRYGARGWDLLPHSDTIRDVPYIFQDWIRRVINTLQGSGSRGGYAAV